MQCALDIYVCIFKTIQRQQTVLWYGIAGAGPRASLLSALQLLLLHNSSCTFGGQQLQ
jgi:hypothetical protein